MPNEFDPQRQYSQEHDVRDWRNLVDRVARGSEGLFWPILGARRSGKTWALNALAAKLDNARFFNLNDGLPDPSDADVLLIDEPGTWIFKPAPEGSTRHDHIVHEARLTQLLAWCEAQKKRETAVVVALTPGEWATVEDRCRRGGKLLSRELQSDALKPLNREQALALGGRTAQGKAFVERLLGEAPIWTRSPFLLTVLLKIAHEADLLDDIATVCHRARRYVVRPDQFEYIEKVFYEGLIPDQQQVMREVSEGATVDERSRSLLESAGLLADDADEGLSIADPVLREHLPPPLIIHHLSDLHFGPKSAQRVDAKDSGPFGQALAKGAGQGAVRQDYREWSASRSAPKRPNLVVVSGDLAEWGLPEEFKEAIAWLVELEAGLAAHPDLEDDDPRILLVGGNHDVDWRQTRGAAGARKRHLPLPRAMKDAGVDWPRPQLEEPPEGRNPSHIRFNNAGLEVALLGSAEFGGQLDHRLLAMTEQLRHEAVKARDQNRAEDAKALGHRYGRMDPGLVHDEDIRRLRRHDWKDNVRIAVLHHPVSPVPGDTEVAPYAGLVNAGQVKDALLEKKFSLVLHGHVHKAWISREAWPGRHGERSLTIASAASLGSSQVSDTHGFNEVRLYREGQQRRLTVRHFERKGQGFEAVGDEVAVPLATVPVVG